MNKNATAIWALFQILSFIVGTLLFIMMFRAGFLGGIDVMFYRGIALLLICSIVMVIGLVFIKQKFLKEYILLRDVALSVIVLFCINLVFFTHIPVTADRSITIFILGAMNKSDKAVMTQKMVTDLVTDRYINELDAINKRFHEQIVTGNIIQMDDGYTLSPQGKVTVQAYQWIVKLFSLSTENI